MDFVMQPIGVVHCSRAAQTDDHWARETATVELDARFSPESLAGLDGFSHVMVVFVMHGIDPGDVELTARHPRNREDWPKVGIFAQRGRRRPNRIGVSVARVIRVDGRTLTLDALDAIDGTPVLDLKPWVDALGPRGQTTQPPWMDELMREYW